MHGDYDQIAFFKQYETTTMQQMALLHTQLEKELPFIHKTRLNCLMHICNTAATNNTLFLTGLGRKDPSETKTSSNIEKVNRLLGNKYLQLERAAFYQTMTYQLISSCAHPWIHVDWSCINPTTNLYLLRASISASGRSIVLYEECHPKKKENNHATHKKFLNNLKAILPSCATPVIVTDAGFRAPWFEYIISLGWEFVGRLRNKNLVLMDDSNLWQLSSHFFKQATGKPAHLGHALLTKKKRVPVHMVLYKAKSKNRHKRNLNKKISSSGKSKRYSKASHEPWSLVTSLPEAQNNPNHIVNIYRQRMRIEENFRDTKCPHYGLGLKDSLTKAPERMEILLLIAAIATFAAWLAGIITIYHRKAADYQAHSAKFRNALSIVYLGRQVIQKEQKMSKPELILSLGLLLQMVEKTQLEQGLYE